MESSGYGRKLDLIKDVRVAVTLARQEVKGMFRQSALGPLWHALSLGIQIAVIGVIFSFATGSNPATYVPSMAVGLTFWHLISGALNSSATAVVQGHLILRQMRFPVYLFAFQALTRQMILLGYGSGVLLPLLLYFRVDVKPTALLFVPALVVVALSVFFLGAILGIINVRFRDIAPLTSSALMMIFYTTPILWSSDRVPPGLVELISNVSIFYHWIELLRGPILGISPEWTHWEFSLVGLAVSFLLFVLVVRVARPKVVYWL